MAEDKKNLTPRFRLAYLTINVRAPIAWSDEKSLKVLKEEIHSFLERVETLAMEEADESLISDLTITFDNG